jgi:flagellar protein FliO/FliZ
MGDFLQMMGWLFVILALVFLVLHLLKRYGPRAGLRVGGGNELKIISQIGLGPKKNLVVVRFLNKILVIGVTDTQINLVTEMTADEHPTFKELLDKTAGKNESSGSG